MDINPMMCPVVRIELTHIHTLIPDFNMGFATIPLSQIWAGEALKVASSSSTHITDRARERIEI
jgi:hypothetical protein